MPAATETKSEARFTSGPWSFHEDRWNGGFSGLFGPNGEDIVVPQHKNEGDSGAAWFEEISDENRALIEAAPSLYAALVEAAVKFREYERIHRAKDSEDGDRKAEANAKEARFLEGVLAFARGEAVS